MIELNLTCDDFLEISDFNTFWTYAPNGSSLEIEGIKILKVTMEIADKVAFELSQEIKPM